MVLKRLIVLLLIITGLICSLGVISCHKDKASEIIKIGILSPATGASAVHGEQGLAGAEMALKELEQSDQPLPIKYIVEDTKSEPAVAVSAAQKLINIDKVKIIVGWLSSSDALAIAPICEKEGVLFFAVGTSTPKLSGFGKYVFRHAPLASAQAEAAAEYVVNILKSKSIGVLYINDSTGVGYNTAFSNKVTSLNGKIIAVEQYEKTDTSFRTQIIKLKAAKVDALYTLGVPRTLGFILKQSKELAYSPKIVSNFGAEGQELLDIAGKEAEGIVFTSFAMDIDFINKFKKGHNNKSPEMLVALTYDSMSLLFDAVRQAGNEPSKIAEYLRNMKPRKGATGLFHFDLQQDAVKEIVFKTVKNSHFVLFKKE